MRQYSTKETHTQRKTAQSEKSVNVKSPSYGLSLLAARQSVTVQAATENPSVDAASLAPPAYGLSFIDSAPVQRRENKTGLPDQLKSGVESLSGIDMSDVKVHYNSSQPAQLNAHAYAQGNQIHIGPGQEKHLPHEAWHVVQQKQGRVRSVHQLKGVSINDEVTLEKEADTMGAKASNFPIQRKAKPLAGGQKSDTVQMQSGVLVALARYFGIEATISSVATALGISSFTLMAGLAVVGTVAAAWSIHRIINYFRPAAAAPAGHEHTHHNFANPVARRNSIVESQLLDTIVPAGAPIPAGGLTIAQFQARFQPLVAGGQITVAQLNALLPPGHAVDFPAARHGGPTEIRGGRKWRISNPAGGHHEIWVHTNDPLIAAGNSANGPVVRVRCSDGKFLSDVPLNAPADLRARRDKAAAKGNPTGELDAAIASRTGQWTIHSAQAADNQHIPLV